MIGGFLLGLLLGLAMGVCLYREAFEYFRLKDAQEQKHLEHLERVREWERKQEAGVVWGEGGIMAREYSQEYLDYIQSQQWQEKAERRKALDGHKCQMCGKTERLQVHHISYERLMNESINDDLVTLCEECHSEVHSNKEYIKHGIVAGTLILAINAIGGGIEGFLYSRGISGKTGEKYAKVIREKMQVLYIPVPDGGMLTVPFNGYFQSEKDLERMSEYLGKGYEYDCLMQKATKIYYAALDGNGFVDDIQWEGR